MKIAHRPVRNRFPAIFSDRRNVDGVTAIPGVATFSADTAAGIRSEGNSGA
jgi:hypothetical protein